MKKIILFIAILIAESSVSAQSKKILFVMSAAQELPLRKGKVYSNTGVFLSEFYLAYHELQVRGYSFDFATPGGIVSKIDKESYDKKYWKGKDSLISTAVAFIKSNNQFNHPITLEMAYKKVDEYDGLIIPGGQGLMVDLIKDTLIQKIITNFAIKQKSVGLICHAPALLTSFSEKEQPFKGYKVNAVTGLEEWFIENFVMKGKPFNRKIGKQLKGSGFKYIRSRPGKNFAVRDRNLVTSQNPFSNDSFNRLYIESLQQKSE